MLVTVDFYFTDIENEEFYSISNGIYKRNPSTDKKDFFIAGSVAIDLDKKESYIEWTIFTPLGVGLKKFKSLAEALNYL